MSDSREQILSRVRTALAPLTARAPLPEWDRELVVLREALGVIDVWSLFAERMKAVNGTPLASTAELVTLLESRNWKRGYCDPALWPQLRAAFPASIQVETEFDRARIDEYDFGITAATGAIAETGTLILSDRGTSRRLGALAPWVHIAVVRREQIFPDLPSAVAALPADPNVIWVTGPSKTADVEGILIEGVHGPGYQVALLLG
ncbi:MAG TPA: LUD domain-containing protein [Opitutaceae bacterium]|nr:LUD domain-containing protein [Opitutaceae bacterium]